MICDTSTSSCCTHLFGANMLPSRHNSSRWWQWGVARRWQTSFPPLPFLSFPPVPIAFSSVLCFAPAVVYFPLCHYFSFQSCIFTKTHMRNSSRVPARFIAGFPCCTSAPHHALLPFAAIPTAVPPPLPLSSVCTCSLRGCFIDVDSARAIGAVIPKDRKFSLGLWRCGMWLLSDVQLGNGVGW